MLDFPAIIRHVTKALVESFFAHVGVLLQHVDSTVPMLEFFFNMYGEPNLTSEVRSIILSTKKFPQLPSNHEVCNSGIGLVLKVIG